MKSLHRTIAVTTIAAALAAFSPMIRAAAPEGPNAQAAQSKPVIPARIDVTIARYQADKKVASLPYTMMVSINGVGGASMTSLRMGVDIPVGTSTTTRDGVTTTQPSYRNVGTNIDCRATSRDDGRFDLYLSVVDSALSGLERSALGPNDRPAFRQFSTSNTLALGDGQPMQFVAATDPITGDVIRIEVTLRTVK